MKREGLDEEGMKHNRQGERQECRRGRNESRMKGEM